MTASPSLTEQLCRYSVGDRAVAEAVLKEVLPRLHEIAVRELRRERFIAPLSPTELINEIWLRNLRVGGWQITSREHFFAIAALAMRRVLVDFARSRLAHRRGDGNLPRSLDELQTVPASVNGDIENMMHIGLLMDQLEKVNPEASKVVDMHYFAGFTLEEIADITGLTLRQVRHRWEKGRNWLKDHM